MSFILKIRDILLEYLLSIISFTFGRMQINTWLIFL